MTSTNAPEITSAVAVANVYATLDTAFQMWGSAYVATRDDVLAGHTHKAISAAWKALGNPGIPTSVAMVASFSAASFLTETGRYADAWRLAFKGKENESGDVTSDYAGEIEPAHRIIERARKANGIDYVNDVITELVSELKFVAENFNDEPELRDGAVLSRVFSAVADIKALATKFPQDDDGTGDESGEGSEDESEGESEESTPDDRAASVIAVLTALVNGGIPASDPMNMEMARLAKAYFAMCAPAKAVKSA